MAEHVYDLTGAEAIVRDIFTKDDTFVLGEWACFGASDGTDHGMVKSGEGVYKGFVGIFNEGITNDGTIDLFNMDCAKVVINPFAVYRAKYDDSAGISVSATALDFTCTTSKGHPNLGGGWLYRVVDPGAGELDLVEDSSTSSTTCSVVVANTPTTAFTTVSDFIIIMPLGQYAVDFGATDIDADDLDAGDISAGGTDGLAINVLENYIQHAGEAIHPLKTGDAGDRGAKSDVGRTGLDNVSNLAFYADICGFRGSIYVTDLSMS